MKAAWKILLVGVVTVTMAITGMATANASVAAPASAAAPAIRPVPPGGGSGLNCRSHAAESKPVSGKVVVPKSYCYDPTTNNHRAWHDYCTDSPDSWNSADFRGPCARHDMCLQSSHSHSKCDGPLLSNMKTNCKHAYPHWYQAATKATCYGIAYTYYAVIKVHTKI